MRKTKEQKAITLVALIITIIILLILAVVAIRSITGDGILQKAREAADATARGQVQEELDLALSNLKMEEIIRKNMTQEEKVQWLQSELQKQDGNATVNTNGNGFSGMYKDYNFSISEDYKVIIGDYAQNDNNNSNENNNDNADNSQGGNEGDNNNDDNNGNNSQGGPITWTYNGDGSYTSSNGVVIEIGDYVNYDEGTLTADTVDTSESGYDSDQIFLPTNDLKWRLLGVNSNGQLELISDDSTNKVLYLKGKVGWQNSETTLDTVCDNLYGNGKYAVSARSLDVDDVDKLTNYDRTSYENGQINEYGNKITYSWDGTKKPYYSGTNGVSGNLGISSHDTFNWFDEETNTWKTSVQSTTATSSDKEQITTIRSTCCYYKLSDHITPEDGFAKPGTIRMMLYAWVINDKGDYWLATRTVQCNENIVCYCVSRMRNDSVFYNGMFWSNGYEPDSAFEVRPVVTLNSDINIEGTGENIGTEDNMWSIIEN